MYDKKFQSPTGGSVSIVSCAQALVAPSTSKYTPNTNNAPRLYSTPNEPVGTGFRTESPRRDAPLVIDLEPDTNCRELVKFQSPISPISKSGGKSLFASAANLSVVGNYSNLEDALSRSGVGEESALVQFDEETGEKCNALEVSQEEDEDISIISERVLNKSRNVSINTLALEQTSCPYVDKRSFVEA